MKLAIALLALGAAFWWFVWILLRGRAVIRSYEPDEIEAVNDRNRMACAMRAWETGKMVVGEVDEDGKLTMREIDMDL